MEGFNRTTKATFSVNARLETSPVAQPLLDSAATARCSPASGARQGIPPAEPGTLPLEWIDSWGCRHRLTLLRRYRRQLQPDHLSGMTDSAFPLFHRPACGTKTAALCPSAALPASFPFFIRSDATKPDMLLPVALTLLAAADNQFSPARGDLPPHVARTDLEPGLTPVLAANWARPKPSAATCHEESPDLLNSAPARHHDFLVKAGMIPDRRRTDMAASVRMAEPVEIFQVCRPSRARCRETIERGPRKLATSSFNLLLFCETTTQTWNRWCTR